MAPNDALRNQDVHALSKLLGDWLAPSGAAMAATPEAELRESFRIWSVAIDDLVGASRLTDVAEPTGYWHHQIYLGDVPAHFAHSRPLGGEAGWQVVMVGDEALASKVGTGVAWIDEHVTSGDPLVRLFWLPSYQLTALWIIDEGTDSSRLLVVDAPKEYLFREDRLYRESEFVDRLLRTNPSNGILDPV